ncbi:hypothetical protein NIES970_17140 [[Synechococcus] sp. NIES-970]|nr:hypothetical protein NIES970_17140 [[Synechococcus] sp. NIES-970]
MTTAPPTDLRSHLAPWLRDAIRQAVPLGAYLRLQVRLRGNTLHLLCETTCPTEEEDITPEILRALQRQPKPIVLLQPPPSPEIYRLVVYGRLRQAKKSLWLSLIELETPQKQKAVIPSAQHFKKQARSGSPTAIAQYLSQNLGILGVSMRVETQTLSNPEAHQAKRRLWITCECDYSPDYSLLTEPLVQRLRELQIKGFRDGAIRCQIRGEAQPEWLLWVDLTPPEVMLRQWARWGDAEAIATLLTQTLKAQGCVIQAATTDYRLALTCAIPPHSTIGQAQILAVIENILAGLAPQGLHQVSLQGRAKTSQAVLWETTWPLPGATRSGRQATPVQLAQQGNLVALKFLLQRCLNPQLQERLATGGVHITLRRREATLYVMVEAIACPPQGETIKAISALFRTLETQPFTCLNIYGRRSGQSQALWQQVLKLAPTPSAPADVSEPSSQPLAAAVAVEPPLHFRENIAQITCDLLKATKIWCPMPDRHGLVLHRDAPRSYHLSSRPQRRKLACLWGLLGVLMVGQLDWLAGRWLQGNILNQGTMIAVSQDDPSTRSEVLNAQLPHPDQRTTASQAIALSETTAYPSFDNDLIDDKLALYQKRVATNGVPDILIIGSSRALRGLDPFVLHTALQEQGYPPLDIFNFGVNGATVQVFDFLLRQVIPPEQLPKLIILADGARAFNSGRQDLTYDLLTASPGFQALQRGDLPQFTHRSKQRLNPADLNQAAAQWFGDVSQVYNQRALLKDYVLSGIALSPTGDRPPEASPISTQINFNLDGFLPLDRRFDPESYYQNHGRVTGDYDGDYAAFSLNGSQQEAFLTLLAHLKVHHVDLVFLNQPLSDHYLDPVRQRYEKQFRVYFRQLAAQQNFNFVDFVHQPSWRRRYDFFSDPSHLNQFGAAQVARELAAITELPWPQNP